MFMPMFVHCEMWTCLPMFPQGFLDMLEKFASFTINLEVALFIFCMLLKARNSENRYVHSCLPSSVCCSRHTTLKTGMGRVVYHLLYAAQGTQLWKQVRAQLSTIFCMLLKAHNSENRYGQSCLPSSSVCCSRHATLKTGTCRVVYLNRLYATQGMQLWKQVRAELSTFIFCMLLKARNS